MSPAARRRAVVVAALAAGLLCAALALWLSPLEPGVVALQLNFTPARFARIVHAWSAEGVARFRAHLPWDYLLLLCYGAGGALWAAGSRLAAGLGPARRRCFIAALPLAALADATENTLHLWLTATPRFGTAWPYLAAGIAASLKWSALLAFAGVCLQRWASLEKTPA